MKKLTFLILAIAVILSVNFISLTTRANNRASGIEISQTEMIERAQQMSFQAVANSSFAVRSPREEFTVRQAFVDDLNMTHVRMDQQYQGVKVFQGEVITHFNGNGTVADVTGQYYGNINISTTPKLSEVDAITVAAKDFSHSLSSEPKSELMVFPQNGKFHLAYRVEMVDIDSDSPKATVYFVNAKNGKVLFQYDNLETTAAVGSGKSLYLGTVSINTNSITGGFEMRDTTRGGTYTTDMKSRTNGSGTIFTDADNAWGNFLSSDAASAAVDAHYGVQLTFDYYKNIHGRNGIANDGKGSLNRVHYSRRYNNAFWSDSCFCMTYGDGDGTTFTPLTCIDVAGHEMSHGVMARTANLTYSGESGGLNEANSDIFGTCVEFYANNASDPGDYLIGEKISARKLAPGDPGAGKYLRSMIHPSYDGASKDYYTSTIGSLDVHYSSGVANNFFYLLSEGGTNDTSHLSVTGITRAKAEKIWYRALTTYFTAGTNYAAARVATVKAAGDLYGAGSVEQNAVASAWTACGVN